MTGSYAIYAVSLQYPIRREITFNRYCERIVLDDVDGLTMMKKADTDGNLPDHSN